VLCWVCVCVVRMYVVCVCCVYIVCGSIALDEAIPCAHDEDGPKVCFQDAMESDRSDGACVCVVCVWRWCVVVVMVCVCGGSGGGVCVWWLWCVCVVVVVCVRSGVCFQDAMEAGSDRSDGVCVW